MLQHIDAVGGGDGHGPARSALADDHRDDGHAEGEAGIAAAGDGLRLPSLLGADAGIGACRVDQAYDGKREAVGHLHETLGLAVALWPRHAEIVLDPAFGVGAFLVPDDHGRASLEASDAADDRLVLGEEAV